MAGITAKEIAEMIGISPASVSMALNGKPGVSENTRTEVLRVAAKYGYTLPSTTNAVNRGGQKLICFLIYIDALNSIAENATFSAFVLKGIESRATQLGYTTIIRQYYAGTSISAFQMGIFRDIDGLIVLGTDFTERRLPDIEHILTLAKDIPVVLVDSQLLQGRVDCIGNANFHGAHKAVTTLIERGCKSVGHVCAKQRISVFDDRRRGVNAALKENGMTLFTSVDASVTSDGAYRDICQWLDQKPELPEGFFADNDVLAVALMRALNRFGISVPKQVSVIGFDDAPICDSSDPPLTTMHCYTEQLGSVAVELIHIRLNGNPSMRGSEGNGKLCVELSVELHERRSVR